MTLDCWRKKDIYECLEDADNNCQPLRDQGCASVKVTCKTRPDGLCAVKDEILSCPVERCDEAGHINCGKKPFCVGTSCITPNPKTSKNSEKTLAYLAALNDAAGKIKAEQIDDTKLKFIFPGKAMECSDAWSGAKDCCGSSPDGWAEGVFMSCDAEEKLLAKQRASGLAVYAGSYCNNRIPITNICASRHQVHCVFESKLAKIIQEEGRYKQLGRSFWRGGDDDSDHSDCSGISIEELQKLDFSKMDFSSIAKELEQQAKSKLPTINTLNQKINYSPEQLAEKMQKMQNITVDNQIKTSKKVKDFYDKLKK